MALKKVKVTLVWVLLIGALGVGAAIWVHAGTDPVFAQQRGDLAVASVPLPEPRVKRKTEENLPVIRQASKPVKADDLEFQVVSNTIWPMPARIGKSPPELTLPTGESPVHFQLRVTNHGKKEVRFLSLAGTPILQSADGKEFEVHFFGNDHTCSPKLVTVEGGQQTQVCLGFRMTTVEKWRVRIIPSIATVSIKSADGVELPARKTGAKVPVAAQQRLDLQPEWSHSVANAAILFHAGKSLTLAWADGAGNVWHVENLKLGKYSVRYVIQGEKGEYINWVGEIQTAPTMVEIL